MKTISNYLFIVIVTLFLTSCETPIDVSLDTANPKLVIDAVIKWQKGTSGNEQKIKLTTTTNFYANTIPIVSGATVYITNSTNAVFNFIEMPNTGEYLCTNFVPVINENYTLTVINNGQTYKATDKLLATPDIDNISQIAVPGVGGANLIQVKFFYQDNGLEDNFYLIGFKNSTKAFGEFGVVKDRFFQGNQMFGFYSNDKLKAGNKLNVYLQGISERYNNYMEKLLNIAATDGGNPFSTPPATLRGNIINQTNEDNFALGYFSLGEVDTDIYTVQ
ncbi:DUF4249 domain-containing protein [Flavobacterium psychrophilum]|uniref:DUF4249 domain-containing protein n=1 Tax=Flavobacterium psychrophilum TaxID=96345 RepID=UPI000B7C3B68|nr:DUF4249 domain-containing protein [Flavobacterium psychrophilum]ELV7525452.1 DUF4249 domain-containing protein [Flavobacterium psychrophilum]ELY2011234.1 DUF4249 domain-containing protein [Flavobacterium psychrophilum]SNA78083.1 putative lipoprotein [Flavobacterium psychrophilum]